MIEVRELVKNYGSKRVLDHISFDVNKGEILGLLGANGAGENDNNEYYDGESFLHRGNSTAERA